VLFLAAGYLAGRGILGNVSPPGAEAVEGFAELALFSVLFTDGMRLQAQDLKRSWLLPTRALVRGMPLTILGIAVLGKWLAGMNWTQCFSDGSRP
jgi:sodium/hydrogen antiporter